MGNIFTTGLSNAVVGLLLIYLTIISAIAEKYLFSCNEKKGKNIHIKGVTSKGMFHFLRWGYTWSTIGCFFIAIMMGKFGGDIILGLGFLVLALFTIASIMLMADSSFKEGHMVYRNKLSQNWNFIRAMNLIMFIVIIVLLLQMTSRVCSSAQKAKHMAQREMNYLTTGSADGKFKQV